MLKPFNNQFSHLLLALILLPLFSTLGLAQSTTSGVPKTSLTSSTPSDVLGWQNSRWGMTISDMQKTFASFDNKASNFVCGDPDFVSRVCGYRDFQIADESFMVTLATDKKTNGLDHIFISLNQYSSTSARLALFRQMEELLMQKYGEPKFKKDNDVLDATVRNRQWVFPSTIIELSYSHFARSSTSLLMISYKPASSSDANKL